MQLSVHDHQFDHHVRQAQPLQARVESKPLQVLHGKQDRVCMQLSVHDHQSHQLFGVT